MNQISLFSDAARQAWPDRVSWEELVSAPIPKTIINEPIVDFVVDFAVEEPQRESATARAIRRWFKQKDAETISSA